MNEQTFDATGRKVNRKSIAKMEAQLGVDLPEAYKDFIRNINGGIPSIAFLKLPHRDDLSWIDYLFQANDRLADPDEHSSYGTVSFALALYGPMLPPHSLPIAIVSRDNPLFIALAGRERGHIFIKWLEELPFPPEGRWEAKPQLGVHHVANSFPEILDMLQEDPEA